MMKFEEDTEKYTGFAQVLPSRLKPGMILLEVWMNDQKGDSSSAGIRLTRNQARQMADELNRLADDLFFQEQRGNKS